MSFRLAPAEQFPSPLCRDNSVTLEPGRFAVALEESAVGHDEVQVDPREPARGAGDAFDQGVSHDLAARGTCVTVERAESAARVNAAYTATP